MPSSSPRPRQVFVTRSRMLVAHTRRKVEDLFQSFHLGDLAPKEAVQSAQATDSVASVEGASAAEQRETGRPLPSCWSELLDEDFPLIITFDDLCSMVEADLQQATGRGTAQQDASNDMFVFLSA